jgi:hypothetical protein
MVYRQFLNITRDVAKNIGKKLKRLTIKNNHSIQMKWFFIVQEESLKFPLEVHGSMLWWQISTIFGEQIGALKTNVNIQILRKLAVVKTKIESDILAKTEI